MILIITLGGVAMTQNITKSEIMYIKNKFTI